MAELLSESKENYNKNNFLKAFLELQLSLQ